MKFRTIISAVLSAIALLLLVPAAVPVFATSHGNTDIGWTGTFAIDQPAGLIYYQVSAAFSGRPPSPNMLEGAGVIAQCIHPPNPNTPYVCDTDPSTLESFDATGALTIDPTTGQTIFTWVVRAPGPGGLPGGSNFVSLLRQPGPGSTGTFTLTFPSELQVTGNFLGVVRSR